ncbi:hypothetical protein BN1708_001254 [Verticillium longisporum]|uniref:Uncharacterized protein n=1 Tax=Verticillium longisporum TaxID=100787 RepID=A0A0G4MN36_VERLO|nr:hypothetical protein BN1708_001254 [Verticillium longisporum]
MAASSRARRLVGPLRPGRARRPRAAAPEPLLQPVLRRTSPRSRRRRRACRSLRVHAARLIAPSPAPGARPVIAAAAAALSERADPLLLRQLPAAAPPLPQALRRALRLLRRVPIPQRAQRSGRRDAAELTAAGARRGGAVARADLGLGRGVDGGHGRRGLGVRRQPAGKGPLLLGVVGAEHAADVRVVLRVAVVLRLQEPRLQARELRRCLPLNGALELGGGLGLALAGLLAVPHLAGQLGHELLAEAGLLGGDLAHADVDLRQARQALLALVDYKVGPVDEPLVNLLERLGVVGRQLDLLPEPRRRVGPLDRLHVEVEGVLGRVPPHRGVPRVGERARLPVAEARHVHLISAERLLLVGAARMVLAAQKSPWRISLEEERGEERHILNLESTELRVDDLPDNAVARHDEQMQTLV